MADVRIEIGGADLARPLLDPICTVYDEVFSASPFFWRDDESELHRQRLHGLLDDPTFGAAVAQTGNELVGFAYGFSLPPDTKRWSSLTEAASPELTAECRDGRSCCSTMRCGRHGEAEASGEGCMTTC